MSSILICSTPATGHIAPLSAVARHLVAAGHDVRFLTGTRFRETVEATGATFLPLGGIADIDLDNAPDLFPEREGLTGPAAISFDISNFFLKPIAEQLAAIDATIADAPVDIILTEPLFVGCAALLARTGPRPRVIALGIVPLGLPSKDVAPFGLGAPPMAGPLGPARNAILRFVANRIIFGKVFGETQEAVKRLAGRSLPAGVLTWYSECDAIVQFTVPGFEYPRRDLPSTVHFVGPVARTQASTIALPDWWDDLDGSRPVVHVTQGTVANKDFGSLVLPTIEALAKDDVLVVVSTGGRPVDSLPGSLPANVRVGEMLPYDRLLPLTSVLVTNGGYGGVHYALENSVPLVVAGLTEDKIEVTARVGWSGAGINLRTNAPTAEALGVAVRRVLATDSYREAATRIGSEITASPGLAGLDAVLATFTSEPVR